MYVHDAQILSTALMIDGEIDYLRAEIVRHAASATALFQRATNEVHASMVAQNEVLTAATALEADALLNRAVTHTENAKQYRAEAREDEFEVLACRGRIEYLVGMRQSDIDAMDAGR